MPTTHTRPRPLALTAWLLAAATMAVAAPQAGPQAAPGAASPTPSTCSARSAATVTPVVELYTSEGCSSCPPADRWLSRLKADPAVVALAFHVDYWDGLGWKDRFASPAYTQRQAQQQRSNGARFSYTPQVVLDGVDHQDWYSAALPTSITSATSATPAARRATATVAVSLWRDGGDVVATVQPGNDAPERLAAFWAVTEQGHHSTVKAGENNGTTLTHDFVVREYLPVAAWAARRRAPQTLSFSPASAAQPGHPRHINLVLVDAATGRPVQALKLGC